MSTESDRYGLSVVVLGQFSAYLLSLSSCFTFKEFNLHMTHQDLVFSVVRCQLRDGIGCVSGSSHFMYFACAH